VKNNEKKTKDTTPQKIRSRLDRFLNEMGIAYHPHGLSGVQTESFRSAIQAIYPQLKNNDVRESIEKALRQLD